MKRQFAAIAEAGPASSSRTRAIRLRCYRLAPEKEAMVRAAAQLCAGMNSPSIELLPGKFVVEIKQTGFSKATAVRELMTYSPFAERRPTSVTT